MQERSVEPRLRKLVKVMINTYPGIQETRVSCQTTWQGHNQSIPEKGAFRGILYRFDTSDRDFKNVAKYAGKETKGGAVRVDQGHIKVASVHAKLAW